MQNPLDSSLPTETQNDNKNKKLSKFYFILGIIFNLSLLGFFKYTDFLLENFNAFSQIAHLDFDIPLPHILLPLALSFVTFQQIAFLFDCYKHAKGESSENLNTKNIDFIDYALFISFFPQLIAGPIVHHREMMPQFASMGVNSPCSDFSGSASAHFVNEPQSSISSLASHNPENSSTMLEFADSSKSNNSSLRDLLCKSWQSKTNCHTDPERSEGEVSKNKNVILKNALDSSLSAKAQNNKTSKQSTINYEFLAKGIFIFSIGLFKKVFIADSFAKWANAGFSKVENGVILNIAESWATSLSYTFQLYFDFSGYCDMAIGLGLMFGIILPLNFNSPYKSLNIAEFWRRWHITLGRFLRECLYIPLGGNRVSKILNLRNLFIVAFLSGIWHGAGWGFVIWGVLHGIAMVIHRIYAWWLGGKNSPSLAEGIKGGGLKAKKISNTKFANNDYTHPLTPSARDGEQIHFTQSKIYKILAWFITFNFVNIAWIFFRAENVSGAVNLLKGMFGIVWVELPQKWHRMPETLAQIDGRNDTIFYILIALIVCVVAKNSVEILQNFDSKILRFSLSLRLFSKKIYLSGGAVFTRFVLALALFYASMWILLNNVLNANAYTPFLYFNF